LALKRLCIDDKILYFTHGNLSDRKNKPDTEAAAIAESDRSIRKVNLIS